jgi:hypothetical protein
VKEPAKRGHWLEGKMHGCSYDHIANALEWMPASNQELVLLGLEEMRRPGGDRAEVYRLLAENRDRVPA